MAGIEKICELTGDYEGYDMYASKRNSIQVLNKYKKTFRGAKATLIILKPEARRFYRGFTMSSRWRDEDSQYHHQKTWKRLQYPYILKVEDEELQGRVNGKYINFSYNISDVKRRLKRMLRDPNLKVIKLDKTLREYEKENYDD